MTTVHRPKWRSQWGITLVIASVVLVLALTGGSWGSTQAARSAEDLVAPTLTSLSPARLKHGCANTELTIFGSNLGDWQHTRVRLYQWGTGGSVWEFTPSASAFLINRVTVTLPQEILTYPNRFSVVLVHYTDGAPANPTVPTIPTIPTIPLDPNLPPTITPYPGVEEISNALVLEAYQEFLYRLPIIFR